MASKKSFGSGIGRDQPRSSGSVTDTNQGNYGNRRSGSKDGLCGSSADPTSGRDTDNAQVLDIKALRSSRYYLNWLKGVKLLKQFHTRFATEWSAIIENAVDLPKRLYMDNTQLCRTFNLDHYANYLGKVRDAEEKKKRENLHLRPYVKICTCVKLINWLKTDTQVRIDTLHKYLKPTAESSGGFNISPDGTSISKSRVALLFMSEDYMMKTYRYEESDPCDLKMENVKAVMDKLNKNKDEDQMKLALKEIIAVRTLMFHGHSFELPQSYLNKLRKGLMMFCGKTPKQNCYLQNVSKDRMKDLENDIDTILNEERAEILFDYEIEAFENRCVTLEGELDVLISELQKSYKSNHRQVPDDAIKDLECEIKTNMVTFQEWVKNTVIGRDCKFNVKDKLSELPNKSQDISTRLSECFQDFYQLKLKLTKLPDITNVSTNRCPLTVEKLNTLKAHYDALCDIATKTISEETLNQLHSTIKQASSTKRQLEKQMRNLKDFRTIKTANKGQVEVGNLEQAVTLLCKEITPIYKLKEAIIKQLPD